MVAETMVIDDKKTILTVKKEINITKFAKEAFENLPEASISLKCTSFDYNSMKFTFWDDEECKEHILNKEKIELGMAIFLQRCLDGKWKNPMLFDITALLELDNWDATTVDMAVQTCIFDEVIYG